MSVPSSEIDNSVFSSEAFARDCKQTKCGPFGGEQRDTSPSVTAMRVSAEMDERQRCFNSSKPEGSVLCSLWCTTLLKYAYVRFCHADCATPQTRQVKSVGRNCAIWLLLCFVGIGARGEIDSARSSVSGVPSAVRGGEGTPCHAPLPVEEEGQLTHNLRSQQTLTIRSTSAPLSSQPRFTPTFPSRSLGASEPSTSTYALPDSPQTSLFPSRPPSVSIRSFILDSVGQGSSASRLARATPLPDRKNGQLENVLLWNLKTDAEGWFAIEDLKVDHTHLGAIVKQGHQVSLPLRITAAERVKIYLRSTIEYDTVVAALGDAVGIIQAQKANMAVQSKTEVVGVRDAYRERRDGGAHSQREAADQIATNDLKPQLSSKPSSRRQPGGEKAEIDSLLGLIEGAPSEFRELASAEHVPSWELSVPSRTSGRPPFRDKGDHLHLAKRSDGNYLDERKIGELQVAPIDEGEKRPNTRPKRRQDLAARVTGIQRTIGLPGPSAANYRPRGASSTQSSSRRHHSFVSEPLPSGRQFLATQENPHARMYTLGSSMRERETPPIVTDLPNALHRMSHFSTGYSGHALERLSPLWDGWEESVKRMVAETKSVDWSASDRMLQAVRLQVAAALGSDLAGSRAADTAMITMRPPTGTPRANERRSDTRGRRLRLSSNNASPPAPHAREDFPPLQMLHHYLETVVDDDTNREVDQWDLHSRPVNQKHSRKEANSGRTSISKKATEPSGSRTSLTSHSRRSEHAQQNPPVATQRTTSDAQQERQAAEGKASQGRTDDDGSNENADPPLLKVVRRPRDDLSHRHQMVIINVDALGRRLDAKSGRPLFYNDRVIVGWRCASSELHTIRAKPVVKESSLRGHASPEVPERQPDSQSTAAPVFCSRPDSQGKTVCGHVPPQLALETPTVDQQVKGSFTADRLAEVPQRQWTTEEREKKFTGASLGRRHSSPVTPRRRLQVLKHMVDLFAAQGVDSVIPLFRRVPPRISSQVEQFRSQAEMTSDVSGGGPVSPTKTDAQQKYEKNPDVLHGQVSTEEELFTARMSSSSLSGTEKKTVHTASDAGVRSTKTGSEPQNNRIKATAHEDDDNAFKLQGHQSNWQERERLTSRTLLDVDELCGLDLIKLSLRRSARPAHETTEEQSSHDDLQALKAFIDKFASQDYVDDILLIAPDAPIRTATASSNRAPESKIGRGHEPSEAQDTSYTADSRRQHPFSEEVSSNLVFTQQVNDLSCSTDLLQFSEDNVCKNVTSSSVNRAPDSAAQPAARALYATDSSEETHNFVPPNDPLFAVQWALGSYRRPHEMDSNVCFARARDEMLRYSTEPPTNVGLATTATSHVPHQVATESQLAKIRHLCETIGSRNLLESASTVTSHSRTQDEGVPAFPGEVENANALRRLVSTNPTPYTVSDVYSTHKMAQRRGSGDEHLAAADKNDSSINMLQAWGLKLKEDQQKKRSTVPVAVIDTGVNYIHPDLADSMWLNEEELNGVPGYDDDQNGYVDDVYGWNFLHDNNNPMDDNGHGSHVAGVIGAQRNNHKGVSGISSHARIMALKILDENGEGDVSHAIPAIRYALDNGARIITNSWGGITGPGTHILGVLLREAVADANSSVFVIASGNDGRDITKEPYYPASFLRDWTITVAAHTPDGVLPRWSNYGHHSVHLTAPGENITSTWLGNGYRLSSGTSMAAPMVSGVAAEILAYSPHLQPQQVVDTLIQSSTPEIRQKNASLTGARLNAFRAIILSQMHFFALSRSDMHVGGSMDSIGTVTIRMDTGVLPLGRYHGNVEVIYVRRIGSKHSSMLTGVFKRRVIQLVQISLPVTMKVV